MICLPCHKEYFKNLAAGHRQAIRKATSTGVQGSNEQLQRCGGAPLAFNPPAYDLALIR